MDGSSIASWFQTAKLTLQSEQQQTEGYDEVFASLFDLREQCRKVVALLPGDHELRGPVVSFVDELRKEQLQVLRKIQLQGPFAGDASRFAVMLSDKSVNPIIVMVVLGCKEQSVQDQRVAAAVTLWRSCVKRKPGATFMVVLSGGGFELPIRSEADVMEQQWKSLLKQGESMPKFLLKESDSLDTVGNAVFSYLALRKEGVVWQDDTLHMLVVTSAFHAPRSLAIFRRVFRGVVVVYGARERENNINNSSNDVEEDNNNNNDDDDDVLNMLIHNKHTREQHRQQRPLGSSILRISVEQQDEEARKLVKELKSEYLTNKTIFALDCGRSKVDVERGDVLTLLINLFSKHKLYEGKNDLISKFLNLK